MTFLPGSGTGRAGILSEAAAGYASVGVAAVSWGLWSLFVRPAGFSGPACAFVLFLTMSAPIPIVLRQLRAIDRGTWIALGLLGVFDAGNAWLYFAALQRGPIAVGVLAHYLAPVIVAVAAPWVAAEARSRRPLIAAPLSLLGLALLIGFGVTGSSLPTAALGAASAFFYAALVFAAKRCARSLSGLAVTALHAPLSALCVLAVFGRSAWPQASPRQWLVGLAGTALCGLTATSLFNAGLKRIPAPSASALTYLEPLTAAIVGWVAFGEAISALGGVGAAIILACGAWVVTERRPGPDRLLALRRS